MDDPTSNHIIVINCLLVLAAYVMGLIFYFQHVTLFTVNAFSFTLMQAGANLSVAILFRLLNFIFRPDMTTLKDVSSGCFISTPIILAMTLPLYLVTSHFMR